MKNKTIASAIMPMKGHKAPKGSTIKRTLKQS